jgi:hypothetical protein
MTVYWRFQRGIRERRFWRRWGPKSANRRRHVQTACLDSSTRGATWLPETPSGQDHFGSHAATMRRGEGAYAPFELGTLFARQGYRLN